MMTELSENTQAILLLTAPLLLGRQSERFEVLTPGEYKKLAHFLRNLKRTPADLLKDDALVRECCGLVAETRLRSLLGRGMLLAQALERWQARGIWVLSRADKCYPRRFKTRFHEDAPAVLYGVGDVTLADKGGLAVVGSRQVNEVLTEYTRNVGASAATFGVTVVSGGARGIDQASMAGALDAGGSVCAVLSDGLERAALNKEYRYFLQKGRLLLLSPFDPAAGFNVGNAMQRNKYIYALADAALVVNSDFNKGGTWAGATEQLKKYRFGAIYVRTADTNESQGLAALNGLGAKVWPAPTDRTEFDIVLHPPKEGNGVVVQSDLFAERPESDISVASPTASTFDEVADLLWQSVRPVLLMVLKTPVSIQGAAQRLQVHDNQVREWLDRLVSEAQAVRESRPVRYRLAA